VLRCVPPVASPSLHAVTRSVRRSTVTSLKPRRDSISYSQGSPWSDRRTSTRTTSPEPRTSVRKILEKRTAAVYSSAPMKEITRKGVRPQRETRICALPWTCDSHAQPEPNDSVAMTAIACQSAAAVLAYLTSRFTVTVTHAVTGLLSTVAGSKRQSKIAARERSAIVGQGCSASIGFTSRASTTLPDGPTVTSKINTLAWVWTSGRSDRSGLRSRILRSAV
jgi:hypothetical protein